MSCLQHHQLAGAREGLRTHAAQLVVPPQESGRQEGKV